MLSSKELERWRALVQFDDEIRPIAEKLAVYGDHWILEFGIAFFALNEDRTYLSNISKRLLEGARCEQELLAAENEKRWLSAFRVTADGEQTTTLSLDVLRQAEAHGYALHLEKNRTIAATKGGSISYLHSNYEIQKFGEVWLKDDD